MLLKLIGSIFVLGSCGFLGIAAANRSGGRPRELKKLRVAIQMLETEVMYSATQLPEALKNISGKLEPPWSIFFKYISNSLENGSSYTVEEAWSSSIKTVLKESAIDSSDKELIESFGRILGTSDREDQQKHFKLFYTQLSHHEDLAEELRKRSQKMYSRLGFLFGLVVVIVLI